MSKLCPSPLGSPPPPNNTSVGPNLRVVSQCHVFDGSVTLSDHVGGSVVKKHHRMIVSPERRPPVRLYSRVHIGQPPIFPIEATKTSKHRLKVRGLKQTKTTSRTPRQQMANTYGPMDCITAHIQDETKDVPQYAAVQRMVLYHQVHEACAWYLLPKYISCNCLVQAKCQRASVQAQAKVLIVRVRNIQLLQCPMMWDVYGNRWPGTGQLKHVYCRTITFPFPD